MTLSRRSIHAAGIAAATLTALALAVANFTGEGDNGGGPEYAVTLGLSVAIAAVLFSWAIPRVANPARAGLVTGVIGVLSVAAPWTGLPFVLGPAAIVFGLLGRARAEGRGAATTAVVLGLLATVGGVLAVVIDQAT